MQILLLADIHGNYPALAAIDHHFAGTDFDYIVNCGDTVVYAPFPNEVISWLMARNAVSILGNTDKKVLQLLRGTSFKKPSKPEKRIMYTHTADQLSKTCADYLLSLPISAEIPLLAPPAGTTSPCQLLGIFHGSPAKPHEFLYDTTPSGRFIELAKAYPYQVIVTGHSHTPYHFKIKATHFVNPGSAGRMFDGNPAASCAVLTFFDNQVEIRHHRVAYDLSKVTRELDRQKLPPIYQLMYMLGKKLN